eukprot:scaffold5649_cov130-Cylindrotheca_fusiformis.AAC.4
MAVALLFVLTLSGGNQDVKKEPTSGQAKHVPGGSPSASPPKSSKDTDPDDQESIDEEGEYEKGNSLFMQTIADQADLNEGTVRIEKEKQLKSIYENLENLLQESGLDLNQDDIDEIREGIKSQLDKDVTKYVEGKKTELLEAKEKDFQLDLDQDSYEPKKDGEEDAKDQEKEILTELRDGVDKIYDKAKDRVPKLAAKAEKTILEDYLQKETSEKYTATIEGDVVTEIKKVKKSKKASPTPSPSKAAKKASPTPAPTPESSDDDDNAGDDDDDAGDDDDDAGDDDDDAGSDDDDAGDDDDDAGGDDDDAGGDDGDDDQN